MRDYARSLKIVLLAVIVIFILTSGVLFYFGTSALPGGSKPNVIASVNGEEIPVDRFRRAQVNYAAAYERLTRQRMTPELAERMGLSQRALNELITEAVIAQAAQREGIAVSHEDISAVIREVAAFQAEGRFSQERYLFVLKRERID